MPAPRWRAPDTQSTDHAARFRTDQDPLRTRNLDRARHPGVVDADVRVRASRFEAAFEQRAWRQVAGVPAPISRTHGMRHRVVVEPTDAVANLDRQPLGCET